MARTIRNREFSHAILAAVRHKIRLHYYLYINSENERLVTAVMSLRNQNILVEEEWKKWSHSFTIIEAAPAPQNDILVQNIKSFLRSLYFRTLEEEANSEFTIAVLETLKELKKTI